MENIILFKNVEKPYLSATFGDVCLFIDKNTGYYNASKFDPSFEEWISKEQNITLVKKHETANFKMVYKNGDYFVHKNVFLWFASTTLSKERLEKVKKIAASYDAQLLINETEGGEVTFEDVPDNPRRFRGKFGDVSLDIDRDTGYFNARKLDPTFDAWMVTHAGFLKSVRHLAEKGFLRSPGDLPMYYEAYDGCFVHESVLLKFTSDSSRHRGVQRIVGAITHDESRFVDTEDFVKKPALYGKRQSYAIYRKNNEEDEDTDDFPYLHVRVQNNGYEMACKRIEKRYPDATRVYFKSYTPNAVYLGGRVQELEQVTMKRNHIRLAKGYSEATFLKDVSKVSSWPYQ